MMFLLLDRWNNIVICKKKNPPTPGFPPPPTYHLSQHSGTQLGNGFPSRNHLPGTELLEHRSGKSTHISMISNSVTHLWSYTAPILLEIPHECRYHHAKCWCLHIECWSLRIECQYCRNIDVLQCFKECFMMFY